MMKYRVGWKSIERIQGRNFNPLDRVFIFPVVNNPVRNR